MRIRKKAKKFDELNPEAVGAYHKYHIPKTMGIAILGMDLEDGLYNGGRTIHIVFQRYQSPKFWQRNIVGKNGVIIKK